MFRKQIEFIESMPGLVNNALENAINQNNDGLKRILVDQQMYERGEDGNGKKLRPYSRYTIRVKKSKGQPTDRTTLRDTGAFHSSIIVTGYRDYYEVKSNVAYDFRLTDAKNYGKNILRINRLDFSNFIRDYFIKELKLLVNDRITK